MTTNRRALLALGLGLVLGLVAGWWVAPRYQFKTEGVCTTRVDLWTGEIVVYGIVEGVAVKRELTKEADKKP